MKPRVLLISCILVQTLTVAYTSTTADLTEASALTESITLILTESASPAAESSTGAGDSLTTTQLPNETPSASTDSGNPATTDTLPTTESNASLNPTIESTNEPTSPRESPNDSSTSESPNDSSTKSELPNDSSTSESPNDSSTSASPAEPGTGSTTESNSLLTSTSGSPNEPVTGSSTESATESQSPPDGSNSTEYNNSTQPVTTVTTASSTLPTTTSPINAPDPVPADYSNADVDIPGSMKYTDMVYNENYANPNSTEYKQLAAQTIATVDSSFQAIPQYVKTIVNSFRNGSIVANITIVMNGVLNSDTGNYSICNEMPTVPNTTLYNGQDCNDYLESQVAVVCSSSSKVLCPAAWQCVYDTATSEPSCQSPCYTKMSQDKNYCSAEGQVCNINADGSTVEAVCVCDKHYLNVGDSCLNQNVIIIIASVCGGVLILSLLGVITVMVCRLNKKGKGYPAYVTNRESQRAQDLWASVPGDNTSLHPYADAITENENIPNGKTAELKSAERNSVHNSDSGRETPGVDNRGYVDDEAKYEGRNWENVELDNREHRYTGMQTTDLDKTSSISEPDETYMRSLISSQVYMDVGESDFHFKRPVLRMSNMNNVQSERSDGDEYIF